MNQSIASAVFDDDNEAGRAVSELRSAGVPDSAFSIIAQHDGRTRTSSGDGEVTDEGHGSIIRGLLGGGTLGAGLGVAALAIPGVGPLAAVGAIAAAAVPEAIGIGAIAGGALSGLNEGLRKHGISEDDATYYDERIKTGGTLVSVDSSAGSITGEKVRAILYRHGGHSSAQARTTPAF